MSVRKIDSKPGLHGGDRWAAARSLGCAPAEIIDFSANINPLGLPDSVRQALAGNLDAAAWYPDPAATELTNQISQQTGQPPERVLVGNGGAELIYLLAGSAMPVRAVVTAPTFSEYELAVLSRPYGGVHRFPLRPGDLRLDVPAFVEYLRQQAESAHVNLVFLCNPNNPTGALIERNDVLAVAECCAAQGTTLVVDESFMDFVADSRPYSVVGDIPRQPNLVVLKSLTKFYALPGLRLGYLLADHGLIRQLKKIQIPWSVNVLAQLAGAVALNDRDYANRTKDWLGRELPWLAESLAGLGLRVYQPAANFILVGLDPAGPTSTEVWRLLAARGILVRDCRTFSELGQHFLRLAVRMRPENQRLIQNLGEVL